MALVPAPVLGTPTVGETVPLRARFVGDVARACVARVRAEATGVYRDVYLDPVGAAEPGVVEGAFYVEAEGHHTWEVLTAAEPTVIERGRAFRAAPRLDGTPADPGGAVTFASDAELDALRAIIDTGA